MCVVLLCNAAQTSYNLLVPKETPNCEIEFKTAITKLISNYDHDHDETFQYTETQESALSIDSDIICQTSCSSMSLAYGDTLTSVLHLEEKYKVTKYTLKSYRMW